MYELEFKRPPACRTNRRNSQKHGNHVVLHILYSYTVRPPSRLIDSDLCTCCLECAHEPLRLPYMTCAARLFLTERIAQRAHEVSGAATQRASQHATACHLQLRRRCHIDFTSSTDLHQKQPCSFIPLFNVRRRWLCLASSA